MATLKSVSDEIKKQLSQTSQIARAVGSDLHTLTKVRIFDDGIASDGSQIGTYTANTIRIKKEKGRFTSSKVNLRDTGKLANSYIFKERGDEVVLGFAAISREGGKTNSEIKKKLEDQYGDVFGLTNNEENEIDNIIGDFLDRIYK